MKTLKPIISITAPSIMDARWIKPVANGFALYALINGKWASVQVMDDKGTEDTKDDTIIDLIGSVKDKGNANTINGAKAYTKDAVASIVGKPSDASSDMTIYGLRAYVDSKMSVQSKETKEK